MECLIRLEHECVVLVTLIFQFRLLQLMTSQAVHPNNRLRLLVSSNYPRVHLLRKRLRLRHSAWWAFP